MKDAYNAHKIGIYCLLVFSLACSVWAARVGAAQEGCRYRISSLPPDARGGQAYQLVYDVPIAIEAFWRFKTSFDNTFLERNRYIAHHRFINRKDDVVITENRYSVVPDALFRWQTRVFPGQQRLEFQLINSGSGQRHGHKFHYGYVQLTDQGQATRVTQVAYFDFWGAGFWVWYPWSGGMKEFLGYTARWECKEAVRFQARLTQSRNAGSGGHFAPGDQRGQVKEGDSHLSGQKEGLSRKIPRDRSAGR